jgi:hypothetical protein
MSWILSWLMAQGFKNTFTAASYPHICISAEILRAYLSLTCGCSEDLESVNLSSNRYFSPLLANDVVAV